MTIEWNSAAKEIRKVHGECFEGRISQLEFAIRDVDTADLAPRAPSEQVIDLVRESLLNADWKHDAPLSPRTPAVRPRAGYMGDFQAWFHGDRCSLRHLMLVEFCFDNRQAIGTNLLKAEIADESFHKATGGVSLSVFVTLSPEAKKSGNWDGSVATFYEYRDAIRKQYQPLLKAPIGLTYI